MKIHLSRPSDEVPLKRLWGQVFAEAPAAIDIFFSFYGQPGNAMVLEAGGKAVSAIHMLGMEGLCLPDGRVESIGLTYALATAPEFRGRGYGKAVMNAAIRHQFSEGNCFSALWPAEDSLFPHYTRTSGYQDCFSVREASIAGPFDAPAEGEIWEADPAAYNRFRNRFLRDFGAWFLMFGETGVACQKAFSQLSGGDCYLLGNGMPWGCAACERDGGETVLVKELLCPEEKTELALLLLAGRLPAENYLVRTPAELGKSLGGTVRRSGQLCLREGSRERLFRAPGYFGLAFD